MLRRAPDSRRKITKAAASPLRPLQDLAVPGSPGTGASCCRRRTSRRSSMKALPRERALPSSAQVQEPQRAQAPASALRAWRLSSSARSFSWQPSSPLSSAQPSWPSKTSWRISSPPSSRSSSRSSWPTSSFSPLRPFCPFWPSSPFSTSWLSSPS